MKIRARADKIELLKYSEVKIINTYSNPTDLKITDMRFVDIDGAPKRCTILKIMTNQGITGYGEVRDASSKTYALMLKSRILGENPCNVDRIFRKIKQFGGPSRQGGGVSGIEIALWDLAGKAYGVPMYQLLGGKFRDKVRVYCDTDVDGKHTGHDMGLALKKRMEMGFTFLKMDLGIGLLFVYVGLVLFLAAVDCSYMGIGYKIGTELSKSGPVVTSVICMIIGALTVLAEPAVRILTTQVEEITNEFIKKKTLLITLAVGVGAAIALSAIRIIFGFSILYVLIPGYALCFILSFFIPKIYTAIAFDAGGVVSGPLTSSFILPIALGLCAELQGEASILSLGFGVVAFVALSPLISIEVLGVVSAIKNKRRARKAIEKVLREDDRMIISFETEGV